MIVALVMQIRQITAIGAILMWEAPIACVWEEILRLKHVILFMEHLKLNVKIKDSFI